jgi:hypothetical protein
MELVRAVNMKVTVFMDVTPCGLVGADISEDAASIFRIEVKSLL